MLRSLLLGIVTVSAVASCKGKEGGPAVQAGVTAGKVMELSGTVTAKRGTESRTLAAGNEVSGDDVIETSANSSVSIVLAHNNATWSLGPNKREKVADSMAWSLAKVDKPALAGVESTSAAGRHAEKAGANTGATATDGKRAEEPAATTAAPAAAVDTAAAAPPAQAPSVQPAPGATPPPKPAARPAVAAPMEDKATTRAMDEPPSAGGGKRGGATLGLSGTGEGGGGRGDGIGLGGKLEKGTASANKVAAPGSPPAPIVANDVPPPPPPPPPSDPIAKGGGAVAQPEIQVLATRERAKLTACLDTSTTTLSVVLSVEKGKAKFEVPGGTPAAIASCLAKVAATMKPSANLTAKLTVKLAKQ